MELFGNLIFIIVFQSFLKETNYLLNNYLLNNYLLRLSFLKINIC